MKPAAAFGLSLAARVAYLLFARPAFDGYYWALSSSLVTSGTLALDGVRTARYEPLYPIFLAAARRLTGGSTLGVQLLQCAVASAGAALIFWMARRLANERVAWYAALLYTVHPLLIRHASDLSDSALSTTLLLLFVATFVNAETTAGSLAAGVCLGLTALTRAVVLPVFVLAPIVLAARGARTRAIALAAVAIVTITPMLARDYALTRSILPGRSGVNLFVGNSEYTASLMPEHSPDILQHYADSTSADDAELGRIAWRWMATHPKEMLELKARNLWYFVSPFLVPSRLLLPTTTIALGRDGQVAVDGAPIRPASERIVFTVFSTTLLTLALAGLAARRAAIRDDAILWCAFLSFAAVYALYFPATRYNAPVAFVPLFYAALGIEWCRGAVSSGAQ
jgi:4-amino-4-deoxy-L-arabinose transferase-like glycosyltransferase